MILHLRPLLICLVAYVASLGLSLLAASAMIDLSTISIHSETPTSAILTPMIAIVGFWGICRLFGVPLDPARTFLIGAIAIYGLLFFTGRLVALTDVNSTLGVLVAALVLFIAGYLAVIHALQADRDDL